MSRFRIRPSVRYRRDDFGGVCYVPHRDDFFALNHTAFDALKGMSREYREVPENERETFGPLVRLGIAECDDGSIVEGSYSGPSLIGEFPELPTVALPLVLNTFSTAWCPLLCRYCHADDLMTHEDRAKESDQQIDNVLATARSIPAMVAVITGGDPVSRPKRAIRLIEGLASQKAVVLDTSGVGDFSELMPSLVKFGVHVRVSVDSALPSINDRNRPVNPRVVPPATSAWHSAKDTIQRLLSEKVAVSVQSVVTAATDRLTDWLELRDMLVQWGVHHWVLHVVVGGGKARQIEHQAATHKRRQGLRPASDVGRRLANLVQDTVDRNLPIDIRCTDTDDRPNSVLLVAANGDLYTEGFARRGKVRLFQASSERPDRIQALMAHLDRFGHARRYLNWNPWFRDRASIEDVCIPFPPASPSARGAAVETEFKLKITNYEEVARILEANGFRHHSTHFQRDEYFDTPEGFASQNDFVIRLRSIDDGAIEAAFKGPRFFSEDGASSRLEFEVPTVSFEAARTALHHRGLVRTWHLEKRRHDMLNDTLGVTAFLDELPLVGAFLELEGGLSATRALVDGPLSAIATVERKNYKELAEEYWQATGRDDRLEGLSFEHQPPTTSATPPAPAQSP